MRLSSLLAAALLAAACSVGSAPDAGTDAGVDGGADAAPRTDAAVDAAIDAATDAATDASTDASTDAGAITYTSWHDCGWSDPTCTCTGALACDAVAGGVFEPLGSAQVRVCGTSGDACVLVVFRETEGGGVAQRCVVPRAELACAAGNVATPAARCQTLFSCNLLMGDCPADVMPGSSVIACR